MTAPHSEDYMAGSPAGPFKTHPAAIFTATGVKTIPLTITSSDIDLTSPSSPTGGYIARRVVNGGTAGNLGYYGPQGDGPYTVPLAANQALDQLVSYVQGSGTTTCNPSVVL